MTNALYYYIKGEDGLQGLSEEQTQRIRRSWQSHQERTPLLEKELQFCRQHNIQVLCYGDEAYPSRLRDCPTAPMVLFYLGNAPLNDRRVISIVGTRRITAYGKDLCERITADIARLMPDALIVSGLAYGVDIHAHRGALSAGAQTVGVLAHGLDQIYPTMHKDTAARMTRQGGLLTEYPSGTAIDRYNFVHRNRIVAAIADCTIVVESADRGGSMITGERTLEYGRRLWACPGRLTDKMSEGCNRIIAQGQALPFRSVEDLMERMGWQTGQEDGQQLPLFGADEGQQNHSPEELQVLRLLRDREEVSLDQMAMTLGMPAALLGAILMDLEMEGAVASMPGGNYRLKC